VNHALGIRTDTVGSMGHGVYFIPAVKDRYHEFARDLKLFPREDPCPRCVVIGPTSD
jgi:hypothetical protein